MNKQQIVAEIRCMALASGGRAPGRQAFERTTGVKISDWYPHIWLRWGDALAEAGYAPNLLATKASDEVPIEKYIGFARELGRFPVEGEIRRKAREDRSFPSHSTFGRFGGKEKLLEAVAAHCRRVNDFEDVLALCAERETESAHKAAKQEPEEKIATEFVYLMKSGPHYKIGRTKSLGRRGSELAIKIPVSPKTIHSIETDDPIGVESYWHKRFDDKRGEGEWFRLTPEDVKAFKRWRRIV
ncbi:GIY-YIG nuclease family protein [Candidatus Binatus sp.]|uniref:GIY-YIG nuclease family protein n=1 Tax=Candidatus Binatus sp. TaxID=2811406 RepID=UPI003C75CD10